METLITINRKETKQKMMTQNKVKELEYLTFAPFDKIEGIRHLFSTRLGGVSEGIFGQLNLSYTRGDRKECVDENFERVCAILATKKENLVLSDQTHTTNIRVVTEKDAGKGITRERDYSDIDGLITNQKNLVLATFYADCVPLYFVDPVKKVIGLSHSGWKGTVAGIGRVTVEKMVAEFGCSLEDIQVAIGPSICKDCYEISEDVADSFKEAFQGAQQLLTDHQNGKFQLDLWEANRRLLEDAGIKKEHIYVTDICTCCNPSYLFSHRASQGKRGNLGAFLMLV